MSTISKTTQKTLKALEGVAGEKLTLGSFVQCIRECEEMSQVAFAKRLGISRQYLCDIERGRRVISPKLAASLGSKIGHSQDQMVRLALQDSINKSGLPYEVELRRAA